MLELFNSLPQFLQLCVGLAVVLGALYIVVTSYNARKIFYSGDGGKHSSSFDEKLSATRRMIYERIEAVSKKHEQMVDSLENRVRASENEISELKGMMRRPHRQ